MNFNEKEIKIDLNNGGDNDSSSLIDLGMDKEKTIG